MAVASSAVLRLNFCAKNPPLSPNRKTLAIILKDNDNEQNNDKFDLITADLFDGIRTGKEY
ncbi:MAG: hypothetical protein OHK0038_23100 [Flammeovirgaceae bacterium]